MGLAAIAGISTDIWRLIGGSHSGSLGGMGGWCNSWLQGGLGKGGAEHVGAMIGCFVKLREQITWGAEG